MVCGQCAAALPPDNDFVTCKGCSRGFHYSCTNVRESSWRKKSVEDKALWRCSFCKAEPEGAIQQTAVTPVGLEQGAAAILAILEIQQRKQEKEREEDQERMRKEREEDQERMRKEREEDRGILDKLDQRLDGRLNDIGSLLTKQNEKIEDVKNELAVQIQSKTEAVKTELAVQIQSKTAEVETKLEAQIQRKTDEVREELEDQIQRFRERVEQLEGDPGRSHLEHMPVQTVGHSIKPPTYDGSTSWGMYKRQFEAAALSNRWSDEEKAIARVIVVRGPAIELLQTIPEEQQRVYRTRVAALERRYGDQHRQRLYLAQLSSRAQKASESLPEYEADIRRLVHLAYPDAPEALQDRLAAQHFTDGIRDSEIQKAMTLTTFLQSSQALVRALEIEAAFSTSRPRISAVTIQEEEKRTDT